MTKREICKRLIKTRDYLAAYEKLLLKDNCPFDADDLGACADALRDLLLDLAAPEEEKSPLAMKWVAVDKSAPRKPCPKCGAPSPKRIDAPGYYCEPCGVGFEAEEKHPGIIVDPSGKNPPRCLKCSAEALIKRDLFAVGDEWVCCGKCKAMFRVKPEPEEGE